MKQKQHLPSNKFHSIKHSKRPQTDLPNSSVKGTLSHSGKATSQLTKKRTATEAELEFRELLNDE